MNQKLVIGTTNMNEFELLFADESFFGNQLIERKMLTPEDLVDLLKTYIKNEKEKVVINIDALKDNILFYTGTNKKEVVIMNMPGRMIRTFYQSKYYKINHPNSIIKINVENQQIREMWVYAYKEFCGLETELFKNPMPNVYTSESVCIGTIDRKCVDYLQDSIRIMEGSYTHTTTGLKGELTSTVKMFEYLKNNPFPYDQLVDAKLKLKDIRR